METRRSSTVQLAGGGIRSAPYRAGFALLIVLGSWMYSRPARAEMSFALQVNNTFIHAPGFHALSDNNHLGQVELSSAMRIVALTQGSLWVEGVYQAGSTKSDLFGEALKTKALFQQLMAGAIYKLEPFSWLVPRARVNVGLQVGSLELVPQDGDAVEDRAVAFAGQVLLGVELLWPRSISSRRSVTGGLVIEAGYGFSTPLSFNLAPEEDEKNRRIPLESSVLGSLGTSGAQLHVGAMVRF